MPRVLSLHSLPAFVLVLTAVMASAGQASKQPAAPAVPTLKASAQLVVVDVVVTDSKHKPVHGLKLSDFTLIEDDKQQAISHFEEHTVAGVARITEAPKLPAGIFTNDAPAVTGRPVNVLLLDAVNTPPDGQAQVRDQLIKYLTKIPPSTPIAIYGLGSKVTLLQGITADRNVLSDPATLAKIHNFSAPGRSMANRVSGPEGPAEAFFALADPSPSNLPPPQPCLHCPEPVVSLVPAFMGRYGNTLDALSQLARSLAGIPGRKNLVWFSGSFPASLFHFTGGNEAAYRETMDRLTKSQIAIYSIYTRGVGGTFTCGADFAPPQPPPRIAGNANNAQIPASPGGTCGQVITQSEHGSMSAISAATGGRAFLETNDFVGAMAEAIDEGSSYYTLTFTPTNAAHNGEFHKIKVQLDRSRLTLAYRPGYTADPPEKKGQLTQVAASTPNAAPTSAASSTENLIRVMKLGTPAPTEMLLHVGVIPITRAGGSEGKPAPGNVPTGFAHGPYRRYNVNYYVGRSEIGFLPDESGKMRADLEFVIFVFDPDGTLVNTTSNTMHLNGTQEEINQAVAQGLFYHQEVSTPAKGEYFLRIAVHDLNRDRFGAVEVATSAVKNVVPQIAPMR